MPTTIKRTKDGATHFAAAVDADGRVTRWETDPAAAVRLGEADVDRVRAEYADRPAAGDLEFLGGDGRPAAPLVNSAAEAAKLRAEVERLKAENEKLKAAPAGEVKHAPAGETKHAPDDAAKPAHPPTRK
jgi:hypothetical protein